MSQPHPHWEALVDAVESPDQAPAAIREHLERCPRCARVADEIRALLARLEASRLPRPPREALQRTIDAVLAALAAERGAADHAPAPVRGGLLGALREVGALLIADSLAPNAAVRGPVAAAPRMLLYEAEGFAITLSLSPATESGPEIMGQVTPQQSESLPAGGRAILRRADAVEEVALSPHGEFQFAGPPGEEPPEISIVLADSMIRLNLPSDTSTR
jgi:hypothetical protein